MANTAAVVNIFVSDNATAQDAFQFGDPTDTSWSFTGQNFKLEIKAERDDVSPLCTFSTGAGTIVVDSVTQRVLHLNVPDTSLPPPAEYVYDLIMYDGSIPAVRVQLMQGKFVVRKGVSED